LMAPLPSRAWAERNIHKMVWRRTEVSGPVDRGKMVKMGE